MGHPASTSEPLAVHFGQLGALWDDPGVKKSAQKASDGNMADIAKPLIFIWFFKVFRALGSPMRVQMVALGLTVGTLDPNSNFQRLRGAIMQRLWATM